MDFVQKRVHHYYWNENLNCASTTLHVMSEYFKVDINPQVFDAAVGMHGAGGYQAQCGIVEGTLLFIGILGRSKGVCDGKIIAFCNKFATMFEGKFKSLSCNVLRPEGFGPNNPPHICEDLTARSIDYNLQLIIDWLKNI